MDNGSPGSMYHVHLRHYRNTSRRQMSYSIEELEVLAKVSIRDDSNSWMRTEKVWSLVYFTWMTQYDWPCTSECEVLCCRIDSNVYYKHNDSEALYKTEVVYSDDGYSFPSHTVAYDHWKAINEWLHSVHNNMATIDAAL